MLTTVKNRSLNFVMMPPDPLMIRLFTSLVVVGIVLGGLAVSAYAQDGGDVAAAFSGIITTVTGIIKSLTVVVGILGVTLWGFGKVARPIFPELSNTTNQYISQFVIGVVAVFVAATVVEAITSAIGDAAG